MSSFKYVDYTIIKKVGINFLTHHVLTAVNM